MYKVDQYVEHSDRLFCQYSFTLQKKHEDVSSI